MGGRLCPPRAPQVTVRAPDERRRAAAARVGRVRRFIYPAPRWEAPADLALVELDGPEPTFVLYRPAPEGGPTVLYLHGNGSDLATIAPLAGPFADEGVGFAAVEYPGYGPAGGQRATEAGVLAAAQRGLAYLAEQGVDDDDLVLVGESLGSAVAARLAHEGHGSRLVLVSPFTSMTAMYRQILRTRLWPARLVPDRYETEAIAAQIPVPTLLVHGADDALVPPTMSQRLAELIPQVRRVVVAGRTHNDLWEAPSRLLQEVLDVAVVREEPGATL